MFSNADHQLTDLFLYSTPSFPYVIMICCLTLMALFKMLIKLSRRCTGCQVYFKKTNKLIQVTQSLEPFYKALSEKQLESIFKEETVCRSKIGFKRLTDHSFKELMLAKTQLAVADKFTHNDLATKVTG